MSEAKGRLLGMSLAELSALALALGMPKFAGKQLASWVYGKGARSIEEMTDLSKEHRRRLAEHYEVGVMPSIAEQRSKDGTVKYLFPTSEGKQVETVLIPDGERTTLCVSCEVGCKMACSFCLTGKQGFEGKLTAGDILNQVYALAEREELTNIVFMGQGEPLDNLDNVLKATELLQAPYALGWSPKRITVSTVGVKDKLQRFIEESNCHLAVSLHAADPALREKLMPAERALSIKEIVALVRRYDFSHQRRLTFEYVMLAGVNDRRSDAEQLVGLLRGLDCRVNLIRFHQLEGVALRCSSEKTIEQMSTYLNAKGIRTTVRASRGQDISAACGLLSTKKKEEKTII